MVILFVLLRTFKLNALPCKAVKSFRHAWAVIEIFVHNEARVAVKFAWKVQNANVAYQVRYYTFCI